MAAEAAEAAEAALPVDEVGILNLRIVRSYFVPRERSACSALGEAVYWSAPTPAATVTALLAAGASVEDGGTGGWQPLNLALVSGDTNVAAVRALLAARADVEARPKTLPHQTPLLLAASARQRACLLALIEAGACVNVANQDGERPISLCAEWAPDLRATRACAALLAAGADVCYRGPDGRTPERRALDVGNVEAAAVMRAEVRAELESRQRSLIDEEEREAEATGAKAARSPAKPKQGGGRRR